MDFLDYLFTSPAFYVGIAVGIGVILYLMSNRTKAVRTITWAEKKYVDTLLETMRSGRTINVKQAYMDAVIASRPDHWKKRYPQKVEDEARDASNTWYILALWVADKCAAWEYSDALHYDIILLSKEIFGENSIAHRKFVATEEVLDFGTQYYMNESPFTPPTDEEKGRKNQKMYEMLSLIYHSTFKHNYKFKA